MKLLRKETKRYKVVDQRGEEREAIEFEPNVTITNYQKTEHGSSKWMPSIRQYELEDGTPLTKISEVEFQTLDEPIPRRFSIK